MLLALDRFVRGCGPEPGRISPDREEPLMGGKPNPGTKKDKRLKQNKPKSKKGKK